MNPFSTAARLLHLLPLLLARSALPFLAVAAVVAGMVVSGGVSAPGAQSASGMLARAPISRPASVEVSASSASAAAALAAAADARVRFHYRLGYSVQHNWLCNGWRNGIYRCTAHFTRVNGRFVSLHPSWVPSQPAHPIHPAHPAHPAHPVRHPISRPVIHRAAAKPARNPYPFGQCTWGAFRLAHDNVGGLGNAKDWYLNAIRRGLPTGSVARAGATVVFASGVQGASRDFGHVGHVVRLLPGGYFLMEAMNDDAGWGAFGFRIVHQGWGVHFIY